MRLERSLNKISQFYIAFSFEVSIAFFFFEANRAGFASILVINEPINVSSDSIIA